MYDPAISILLKPNSIGLTDSMKSNSTYRNITVLRILATLLMISFIEPAYAGVFQSTGAPLQESEKYNPNGLRLYENVYSDTAEAIVIGKSVDNRDLLAFEKGSGDHVVLILGGTHGDEPLSVELAITFRDSLSQHIDVPSETRVVLVPIVNPDGLLQNTRTNFSGVDLNRNFPTKNWNADFRDPRKNPGSSAGSEPETQALIDLIETYKPDRIISIHTPLEMVNFDGPALELAEKMAVHNKYPVSGDIRGNVGYPGSLGTYAGIERQIPIITLELPRDNFTDIWPGNRDALIAAITFP